MLFPVSITYNDDGGSSFNVVGCCETTTEYGLNTKDFEKVGGDTGDSGTCWLQSAGNRSDVRVVFCNRLKTAVLIAKVVEIRVGYARPATIRVNLENCHDPIRITVRQWPQQDTVNDTENGCGCANAEREREHGNCGESRTLAQLPQCVANILKQTVHDSFLTCTAAFLTRIATPPWDRPSPRAAPG